MAARDTLKVDVKNAGRSRSLNNGYLALSDPVHEGFKVGAMGTGQY